MQEIHITRETAGGRLDKMIFRYLDKAGSGFVYKMLGIPDDLFTPLFAVSRIAGWCAHRFEEINSGKRQVAIGK